MISNKPYGFIVVFERAKPNGGMQPEFEQVTLRRKGTEAAAKRAAALTRGFREILTVTPIPMEEAPPPRVRRAARREDCGGAGVAVATDAMDAAAEGIQSIRQAVEELARMAQRRRELVDQIEQGLAGIDRVLPETPGQETGASRIRARCERLREFFNMEELESWKITVDRLMEEAWRRLP